MSLSGELPHEREGKKERERNRESVRSEKQNEREEPSGTAAMTEPPSEHLQSLNTLEHPGR